MQKSKATIYWGMNLFLFRSFYNSWQEIKSNIHAKNNEILTAIVKSFGVHLENIDKRLIIFFYSMYTWGLECNIGFVNYSNTVGTFDFNQVMFAQTIVRIFFGQPISSQIEK